ncbi:hypothetical protein D1007_10344 [Hordeum vulgare]|nr:hypothetical protein D1007_10344 [Hordeum vulgare]
MLIGVPPAEEYHIPDDGNPCPRPQEQFYHPNENNLMVGPAAFHLVQQVDNNHNPLENIRAIAHVDEVDIDEGWGHSAMPQPQHLVDVEIRAGEFLGLNNLMVH